MGQCGSSQDRVKSSVELISLSGISNAIAELTNLADGSKVIPADAWPAMLSEFTKYADLLSADKTVMEAALNLVDVYEQTHGPLFMNSKTRGGFKRTVTTSDGKEMERAMLVIQQTILDNIYGSSGATTACSSVLNGRKWQTATFFPGGVSPPTDTSTSYSVAIKATHRQYWGRKVLLADEPLRKPTGLYLSPGGVATVTVPTSIVGKGYKVLIGAHTVNNKNKDTHKRMDRITVSFDVSSELTTVANPLGGGVYIVVPYLADDGVVTVQVSGGVVQAPIFSMTSAHQTTEVEWESLRTSAGPWADFETDKFLMQVPRIWIYNYGYASIKSLLEGYDRAMDGVTELGGYYGGFYKDKHVLYVQPDLHIKHGAYGTGYPQVNTLVRANAGPGGALGPLKSGGVNGKSTHWLVTNPVGWATAYHELGHAQLATMYRGETEAHCNFYHAYIRNVKEGINFDTAFAESVEYVHMTPDQAAINWMITENFRNGKEMGRVNSPGGHEFRYQHRGYAKYADIARLFGWDAYRSFNHQEHLDHMSGATPPGTTLDEHDSRTLRLSIKAGADLTPLMHFWGIHPVNAQQLKHEMSQHNLSPSCNVHDLLKRYATIIPMNRAAFSTHFQEVWPNHYTNPNRCPSPLYGCGWYHEWKNIWDETYAQAAVSAVHDVISEYYHAGDACTTPSTTSTTMADTTMVDTTTKADATTMAETTTTMAATTSMVATTMTRTTTAALTTMVTTTTQRKRKNPKNCRKAKNPQRCRDRKKNRKNCKKAKDPQRCKDKQNRKGRKLQAATMTTTISLRSPRIVLV